MLQRNGGIIMTVNPASNSQGGIYAFCKDVADTGAKVAKETSAKVDLLFTKKNFVIPEAKTHTGTHWSDRGKISFMDEFNASLNPSVCDEWKPKILL